MHKILLTLLLACLTATPAWGWGQTGHRVIGYIAQQYLNAEAEARLRSLLNGHSLAEASTWMDEIRSDDAYDYTSTWHWVTIPTGMTYAATDKNPSGDLLGKTKEIIGALKADTLSTEMQRRYVRFLVHMVGDMHQPLHVGTGDDRGGNDFTVLWFGEPSNLHRVWDSGMINQKGLSFTELARFVGPAAAERKQSWRTASVEQWAQESMSYREAVYAVPQDRELSYRYMYKNFDTVKERLLQAGVRLADVLNEIYG
ncbi:S1/P1 nuclease [Salisaeta longa]|uniref:S1/P1 nuclease n=1 Tax=Salisaeta longa TaxID=503170 RepID=UPI0003B5E7D1|nr:S1/P1 nuclease [Salisaeta longa]